MNDMVEGVDSFTSLFACDVEVMRRVKEEQGCQRMQENIDDKFYNWTKEWEMELKSKKCTVIELLILPS